MPARILIIEDNNSNMELMTYLLQAFGYTPLTARSGEEGLEIVRREEVQLVLCDISMAGMDGYEVARHLKGDPELRAIPLVAITALAMVGDRDRILATGFDGYIAKPIEPEVFVSQVQGFLAGEPPPAPSPPVVEKRASVPESANAATIGKRVTILAVDNTPANLSLMQSILEPSGYAVVCARSTDEALALARSNPPDLILSDTRMPGKSGVVLLHAVKADPALQTIPFILLSSREQESEARLKALAPDADRVIVRPIEPQRVLTEVEQCLRQANRVGLNSTNLHRESE